MSQPVRIPGPDHPITIGRNPRPVTVSAGEAMLAETSNALMLQEAAYPAVHYIPRSDADMTLLEPSEHTTYCPYKGEASYYSVPALGERGTNAVWTYEAPFEAVAEIAGHLAFYTDRVTVSEA